MGCTVFSTYDVGVAGIHRLIDPLKECFANDVDVIVVVAGQGRCFGISGFRVG